MNERGRRGGLVWPFILISVGLVLLLNNLNLTEINLWEWAIKAWPAILIAFGLDIMIPRRTFLSSLLALAAILGVLAGSVWLVRFTEVKPESFSEISEPAIDAPRAIIVLKPTIGDLRVGGGAPDEMLLSGRFSPESETELNLQSTTTAGVVRYQIESLSERYSPFYLPTSTRLWHIRLTDRIPIDLEVNLGFGSLVLDLRSVALRSASADFGVGRAELSLPAEEDVEVAIEGGVGEILVRVPAGESVEIKVDRGLSTMDIPPGYSQEDGTIRSKPGSAEVDKRIQIRIGLGAVRVVEWAE